LDEQQERGEKTSNSGGGPELSTRTFGAQCSASTRREAPLEPPPGLDLPELHDRFASRAERALAALAAGGEPARGDIDALRALGYVD